MPDTNIPVTCPHCDAAFTAPADVAGLPITCKNCGEQFTAPASAAGAERPRGAVPADYKGDVQDKMLDRLTQIDRKLGTIKLIMICFVVLFLIGCCVALVAGTGGF